MVLMSEMEFNVTTNVPRLLGLLPRKHTSEIGESCRVAAQCLSSSIVNLVCKALFARPYLQICAFGIATGFLPPNLGKLIRSRCLAFALASCSLSLFSCIYVLYVILCYICYICHICIYIHVYMCIYVCMYVM